MHLDFRQSPRCTAKRTGYAICLVLCGQLHAAAAAAGKQDEVRLDPARIDSPAPAARSPEQIRLPGSDQSIPFASRTRVIVRSFETATISAEINARITRLPEREGDSFRKGDIIVEFDCSKVAAELSGAVAAFKARDSAFKSLLQMQSYDAAGTLAVDQSRFEMEKATADVEGMQAKIAGCRIVAPFDGRIVEKAAQVHEIAQPNQPIIRIVNEKKLELVLMVPSAWLSQVKQGSNFKVTIDETGETHAARIIQSTGLIEPVSQSIRVIAEITHPTTTVIPGMSGTATFPSEEPAR